MLFATLGLALLWIMFVICAGVAGIASILTIAFFIDHLECQKKPLAYEEQFSLIAFVIRGSGMVATIAWLSTAVFSLIIFWFSWWSLVLLIPALLTWLMRRSMVGSI